MVQRKVISAFIVYNYNPNKYSMCTFTFIWKGMSFNIISYKKSIWKGIEGHLKDIVQKVEDSQKELSLVDIFVATSRPLDD